MNTIKLYNGLPLFNADFEEGMGIDTLSLVTEPATEVSWMMFNAEKVHQCIIAPVMLANTPIYRYSESLGEYYINYTPEVLEKMATDYLRKPQQFDIQHDGELIEGVSIQQLFIKDTNKGINPAGFEDVPDGSLFAVIKIDNLEFWNVIKDSPLSGFSLAGSFTMEPVFESDIDELNFYIQKYKNIL